MGVTASREQAGRAREARSTSSEIVGGLVRSGGGRPLDAEVRARMEGRFGHDFSAVRVHADGRAAEAAHRLDANAATLGEDVVFGAGRYVPGTAEGDRLLAHELTHVVQQRTGFGSESGRAGAEAEARDVGGRVLTGRPVAVRGPGAGGVQLEPRTPYDAQREQFQRDQALAQQAPPLWLSLLGPGYVQAYYRNPAPRIKDPLLKAQADTTTHAVAGGGALATSATAVTSGVAAAVTTLAVAGLNLPIAMGIAVEAAAGSAVLAPAIGVVFTNPVAATEIGVFVAGEVMLIVASGGVRAYLDQLATAEGAAQLAFNVMMHLPTNDGPIRVRGTGRARTGTVEVTITETPVQGPPRPPKAPSTKAPPAKAATAHQGGETTAKPPPGPTAPTQQAGRQPSHLPELTDAAPSREVVATSSAAPARTGRVPSIDIGEIKSTKSEKAGWRQINSRKYVYGIPDSGHEAVITYDAEGTIRAKVRVSGGDEKVIFDDVIGRIPREQLPAAKFGTREFGNAIEDPIRIMLERETGQKFLIKSPSATGPDILPHPAGTP